MNRNITIKFHCDCNFPKPVKTTLPEWLKLHEDHGQICQRLNKGMLSVGLYVLECPCTALLITDEATNFPVGTPQKRSDVTIR